MSGGDTVRANAVEARGLGLATSHGPVFRDVNLVVPAGTVGVVVGAAGSGKSALLLALTGRMRVTEGAAVVTGIDVRKQAARVRQHTSVARLANIVTLENELTVDEAVAERALIDGVPVARAREAFRAACVAVGVAFEDATPVGHLSARERTELALLVTAVRGSDLVVLDDVDAGLTADDEREIYRAAVEFAALGPAVVTATTRREVVPDSAHIVDLAREKATAPRPDEGENA